MDRKTNILKRFVIYMAILTFVMFTIWALIKSFRNRPPGDYHNEVCDTVSYTHLTLPTTPYV